MNQVSSLKKGVGIAVIAALMFPQFMFAQGNSAFCSNLSTVSSRIDQKIDVQSAKLKERRDFRENSVGIRRDGRDERLKIRRDEGDVRRADRYGNLDERAETPEQIQAVADFKAAIEAAVVVRRTEVDAAQADFRAELDAVLASRQTEIDTAVAAYKASIQAAVDAAQVSCDAGETPSTVRQTLKDALLAARDEFRTSLKAIDRFKDQLEPVRIATKDRIKAAFDVFRTTAKAAGEELKNAFGEDTSSDE